MPGEQVDLLQGLDLHVLNPVAQLGAGDPLLVFSLTSTRPTTSTMTTAPKTVSPKTAAKSSVEATTAS